VHDPEVLVLDEPFSGLDPVAVDVVVEVLKDRAVAGAPVLFSSHQLDIVERLCDDLVIIAEGRIRAAGERSALRAEHSGLRYGFTGAADAAWLGDERGVEVLELNGGSAVFEVEDDATVQRVLRTALAKGDVVDFSRRHPSLAEIFKEVIR
jgi:ABC-2 type transport system ATP-binding protein